MQSACFLIWLTALIPLGRAWQANRRTSLLQAVAWAIASWAGWGEALANAASWPSLKATASCYGALVLTGGTAIAVLGARRPGVRAWNFVVVALIAVNLLPLAECFLTAGTLPLNVLRFACLAGPLAVGVLNYLPTLFAPAALALLVGCGLECVALVASVHGGQELSWIVEAGWIAVLFTPWIAYGCVHRTSVGTSEFDRCWLDFRNRFGFVWAQRVREQFNRSAANAGWLVVLRWQGLRLRPGTAPLEPATQQAMLATLRALLKRFGPDP